MARIRVETLLPAPDALVWADVSQLSSHVEWMEDAVELRFDSPQTAGIGTVFTCLTRVGPLRLKDRMVVTEWDEGRTIGIRHEGLVTGSGRFTLSSRGQQTAFSWEERLRFPWWLGGPIGGVIGGRILARIWRRNLVALGRRFEGGGRASLDGPSPVDPGH